jgi:putative nucleotidyltransferase with HDIG domain
MPRLAHPTRVERASGKAVVAGPRAFRLSEITAALSYALDLTEEQPEGHAVRSCLIGMRIADEAGLDLFQRSSLYYALLLKDLGCSNNAAGLCSLFAADDRAARCHLKTTDWTGLSKAFRCGTAGVATARSPWRKLERVTAVALGGPAGYRQLFETRCGRGAEIARLLGFPDATAQAIRHLDEHWDGRGQPQGLRGEQISLLGRILGLAQTAEVFFTRYGRRAAVEMVRQRRGSWFDPEMADILLSIESDGPFWSDLALATDQDAATRYEPGERSLEADDQRIDRVAEGFARVVDAKSPWTFRHSERVAEVAVGIATVLGMEPGQVRQLRRAGLLHDLGKLGVSNHILDKPARLTDDERLIIEKHPEMSARILRRVGPFAELSEWAWAHHERLDGLGYPRGLKGDQLALPVRVLVVADVFDALSAERPYRGKQPPDKVLGILKKDAGSSVCPECVEALETYINC